MNGIIVVNKPCDWTSFDVVAKLRGIFQTKKIGHSGTLDPMATGVLPIFIGAAAKAVDMQPQNCKAYKATMRFGYKTDTADITGDTIATTDIIPTKEALEKALTQFIGKSRQIPPMYSAVKVAGKPLYKYAREGKEIERATREIEIYEINMLEQINELDFSIYAKCSKGSYIRTLIEDIAQSLGSLATMAQLERVSSGVFHIAQAKTIQDIQAAKQENKLAELLLPIEAVFESYEIFTINDEQFKKLSNGVNIEATVKNAVYRCYYKQEFLGIVSVRENVLTKDKFF